MKFFGKLSQTYYSGGAVSFLLLLSTLTYSQEKSFPGNKLNWLNLDNYPTSLPVSYDFNPANPDAEYRKGWSSFYAELANLIEFNRNYVDVKFESELEFTINAEGEITQIRTSPENSTNAMVISESIAKLEGWKPAYRDGVAVSQKFKLKISNKLEIYTIVEKPAMPEGGYSAFYGYIGESLGSVLPLFTSTTPNKTYLQFMVLKDGSINDVKILKKLGAELDKELHRIVLNAPDWNPAVHRDKNVLQRLVMPLRLQVNLNPEASDSSNLDLSQIPDSVDMAQQMGLELPIPGIQPAEFPGGPGEQLDFVEKNKMKLEGKIPINNSNNHVILEFTVDLVGNVRDIQVISSLGDPFDEEAIRIYKSMPLWLPRIENRKFKDSRVRGGVPFGDVSMQKANLALWNHDRAVEQFKKEHYAKAIDFFSKAIEKNPYHVNFYYNRATTHFLLDQTEQGCSDLNKIKSIDEDAGILYARYCY